MKPYQLKRWGDRWWIPERETKAERRPLQWKDARERINDLVPNKRVCVQAGGNWGYWPYYLADMFDAVYTFEPDPRCFAALTLNTESRDNIIRFQAALGLTKTFVDIKRADDTTGNQYTTPGGIIPTLSIDNLGLEVCDLIYLDIEGKERGAILGATATIARCHPIVAFEVTKKYDSEHEVEKVMRWHHYEEVRMSGRDVFMAPKS